MEERVFTLSMREARGGAEIEHPRGCDEEDRIRLRVHVVRVGPGCSWSTLVQ